MSIDDNGQFRLMAEEEIFNANILASRHGWGVKMREDDVICDILHAQ